MPTPDYSGTSTSDLRNILLDTHESTTNKNAALAEMLREDRFIETADTTDPNMRNGIRPTRRL